MNIDLTKLVTNYVDEIVVDDDVIIPDELLDGTQIRELRNIKFVGNITKLCDGDYQISGNLTGIMLLPDDVTLEDVEVKLACDIEENFSEICDEEEKNLEIIQNRLDITEFLWQNILVEIPLKVVGDRTESVAFEGDGWRFITEEDLKKGNNSPFSELSKMFNSRKE